MPLSPARGTVNVCDVYVLGVKSLVVLVLAASACSCAGPRAITPLATPGESAVALTGGGNTSMIYVARTSDGVIAIDLGWWGHERAFERALLELRAAPADVRAVFLTHSHRDHIGAWRSVRHARFHVADGERARLVGEASHLGWIPRFADRVKPAGTPATTEVDVHTFARDTTFVIGTDTLRAYLVAGHTSGSTVFLFRGTLFLGDAVTWSRRNGFAPARRGFSDDTRAAAANLRDLWPRLPTEGVRYVCTAHARCAPFSAAFVSSLRD